MSPQPATAMQPAKVPVAVRQSAAGDVFDRIQQTYGEIARRAFEIFDNNGKSFGHDLEVWFRAASEPLHPVPLERANTAHTLTAPPQHPRSTTSHRATHCSPH